MPRNRRARTRRSSNRRLPTGRCWQPLRAFAELDFSEATTSEPDGVRVVDSHGSTVSTGRVVCPDTHSFSVALRDGLAVGSYVVTWQVVSADGHPVSGSLTFSIGRATRVDAAATRRPGETVLPQVAGVLRTMIYFATLLSAGMLAFALVAPGRLARTRRHVRMIRVATAVALVASVVSVSVQAGRTSARGARAMADVDVLRRVADSAFGHSALMRALALVAVLVAVGVESGRPRLTTGGIAASVACGSFALSGHAATATPRLIAVGADVVHVAAAAVWFGGLVAFLVTLQMMRRTVDAAPHNVPEPSSIVSADVVSVAGRFSDLATVAVLAVGAAGIALAWVHLPSFHALIDSDYGRLLSVKVAIVVVVAALGAFNHYRGVPALRTSRDCAMAQSRLARAVRIEVALIAGVVFVTSVLVATQPPADGTSTGPTPQAPGARTFRGRQSLTDGTVELRIDDATVGTRRIRASFLGRFRASARTRRCRAGAGVAPERRRCRVDPHRRPRATRCLRGRRVDFAIAGAWRVEVDVRVTPLDLATAVFKSVGVGS